MFGATRFISSWKGVLQQCRRERTRGLVGLPFQSTQKQAEQPGRGIEGVLRLLGQLTMVCSGVEKKEEERDVQKSWAEVVAIFFWSSGTTLGETCTSTVPARKALSGWTPDFRFHVGDP